MSREASESAGSANGGNPAALVAASSERRTLGSSRRLGRTVAAWLFAACVAAMVLFGVVALSIGTGDLPSAGHTPATDRHPSAEIVIVDRRGRPIATFTQPAQPADLTLEELPAGFTNRLAATDLVAPETAADTLNRYWRALTGSGNPLTPADGSLPTRHAQLVTPLQPPDPGLLDRLRTARWVSQLNHQQTTTHLLTGYVNHAPFGRGANGINAASEAYFGVPARRLTDTQGTYLAQRLTAAEGLRLVDSRAGNLASDSSTNQTAGQSSQLEPAGLLPIDLRSTWQTQLDAPLGDVGFSLQPLLRELLAWLEDRYGAATLARSRPTVTLAIDLATQQAALATASQAVATPGTPTAISVTVVDDTGGVRALIGSAATAGLSLGGTEPSTRRCRPGTGSGTDSPVNCAHLVLEVADWRGDLVERWGATAELTPLQRWRAAGLVSSNDTGTSASPLAASAAQASGAAPASNPVSRWNDRWLVRIDAQQSPDAGSAPGSLSTDGGDEGTTSASLTAHAEQLLTQLDRYTAGY